jgi:hypothetical protein
MRMGIEAPDIPTESALRQAGAASVDTTALFESVREEAASAVTGAFTRNTRATRLAAVGMIAGDRWLETDTGWEYSYTGTAWAFVGGTYFGLAATRGGIVPTAADNGAEFFETDTLSLWQVAAGAWVKRLQVVGTANQISATIAAGVLTIALVASPDVTTSYKVAGNQVVGARGAAIADAAGGAVIDVEARAALNALLAALRPAGHGLIA